MLTMTIQQQQMSTHTCTRVEQVQMNVYTQMSRCKHKWQYVSMHSTEQRGEWMGWWLGADMNGWMRRWCIQQTKARAITCVHPLPWFYHSHVNWRVCCLVCRALTTNTNAVSITREGSVGIFKVDWADRSSSFLIWYTSMFMHSTDSPLDLAQHYNKFIHEYFRYNYSTRIDLLCFIIYNNYCYILSSFFCT